ncbi:hypothetical protein [Duganella radicis]|uniref:Uncharacterized protein n=1 Tax=Duganella radicis TaxID=551988 RepID=A0A6L6PFL9_9BURK|nr:hypothetical protein [Duganella radicis]MTV37337.1 hypothetical protein [Duganella radicis]
MDKTAEQTPELLAYYHWVEASVGGVQYKIASEIAMWLFLLGPTSSGNPTVFIVRKPSLFRLIGRKYCDAVKYRCFEK